MFSDPVTLAQRLNQEGGSLSLEALARIKFLENLCGMMTDTGVILEEDAAELSVADMWSPDGGPTFYDSAAEAVAATGSEDLEIVELERWHQLENSWAVNFTSIVDGKGREVSSRRTEEYSSLAEAEDAVAGHLLMQRRLERGL